MFTIDNRFSNFNSMVSHGEFHLNSSSKEKTSLSRPRSGDQYNAPSSSYRISVGKQSWTQNIIFSLLTSGRLAVQPTFRLFQTINNINMWWIFTINVSATGGSWDLKYGWRKRIVIKMICCILWGGSLEIPREFCVSQQHFQVIAGTSHSDNTMWLNIQFVCINFREYFQ